MKTWTFIDHITDFLMQPRMGNPREPNAFPSEASAVIRDDQGQTVKDVDGKDVVAGKCRRSSYFRNVEDLYKYDPVTYAFLKPLADKIEKKKNPTDRYMQWIWDAGNMYEEHIINYSKSAGVFIGTQVPVWIPSHRIAGRIDLIVVNPLNGKLSIVEAKSIYGFGKEKILGKTYFDRQTQQTVIVYGVPRDSNLMQIALYQWWYAGPRAEFEEARLVYGARDTGDYGEFLVRIGANDATKELHVEYRQVLPYDGQWVRTPITINSILKDGYQYVQDHLAAQTIPDRDFDVQFTDAKLEQLYQDDELSKVDREKWEKLKVVKIRAKADAGQALTAEETDLFNAYDGKRIKVDQKPVEKGDFNCNYCSYSSLCYDKNKKPVPI